MTWIYFLTVVALIGAGTWRLYQHDREVIRRRAAAEAAQRSFREAQRRWQITHEHARRWR